MAVSVDFLKSGDILLFYHREGFLSDAIRWVTGTWASHVGVVIKNPPGFDGLFLIESSLEPTPGVRSEARFGVQVQPLHTVLAQYDQTWVRRLTSLRGGDCTQELWNAEYCVDGDPYDWHPIDWVAAAIDNWKPGSLNIKRSHSFWCSALAAYLYVQLGFLDPDCVDWTMVSPGEWLDGGDREGRLKFRMCSLSREQRLDTGEFLRKRRGLDDDEASLQHPCTSEGDDDSS